MVINKKTINKEFEAYNKRVKKRKIEATINKFVTGVWYLILSCFNFIMAGSCFAVGVVYSHPIAYNLSLFMLASALTFFILYLNQFKEKDYRGVIR